MKKSTQTTDRLRLTADGGSQIGAVLLAAGESTRFGDRNKLLAEIKETPIVRLTAETLCGVTDGDITVITGHEAGIVRDCLADLPVSFRTNPEYAAGQSTSVREGAFEAIEHGWVGTVFALGDMPFVSSASIEIMIEAFNDGAGSIVTAAYDNSRGNPVLFDQKHYSKLTKVTGDVGGRQLVRNHPESVLIETGDPGVVQDIDYEDDLPSGSTIPK